MLNREDPGKAWIQWINLSLRQGKNRCAAGSRIGITDKRTIKIEIESGFK
jgi:hypothetical protein